MSVAITAFYASLLGAFYMYLSALVVLGRREKKIGIGYGGDRSFEQLIRAHANFIEYVPYALLLMVFYELNRGDGTVLHVAGVMLLFGRLLHAYGLRIHHGASWQRIWGGGLTFVMFLLMIGCNLYLLHQI